MNRASPKERKIGLLIFLILSAGFAGLFLCESVLDFDVGRLFHPCGFKQRTQLPCITCGWTTATRALVRGEIGRAFTLQPAATFVNGMLGLAALTGLFIALTGRFPRFLARLNRDLKWWHILAALTVIALAGWAVTLARAISERSGN